MSNDRNLDLYWNRGNEELTIERHYTTIELDKTECWKLYELLRDVLIEGRV